MFLSLGLLFKPIKGGVVGLLEWKRVPEKFFLKSESRAETDSRGVARGS